MEVTTTQCIACLHHRGVDEDGLCQPCQPVSEDTRAALIALLKPTIIKEVVTTSGEPTNANQGK